MKVGGTMAGVWGIREPCVLRALRRPVVGWERGGNVLVAAVLDQELAVDVLAPPLPYKVPQAVQPGRLPREVPCESGASE